MLNWFKKRKTPPSSEKTEIELKDLGNKSFADGKLEDAANYYRQAIKIKPDYAEAYCNLGAVFDSLNRIEEAILHYRSALACNRDLLPALRNLGLILVKTEKLEEAKSLFERVIRIDPVNIIALENLCLLSMLRSDLDDANGYFPRLINLKPDELRSYHSWALFLKENGKVKDAEALFEQALRIHPGESNTLFHLGTLFLEMKRFAEAEKAFSDALQSSTEIEKIRFNLSYLFLMTGRFQEGWREFEYRWDGAVPKMPRPSFPVPRWSGNQASTTDSLLIHVEHGLGDLIQFSRYFPIAKACFGGNVTVLVHSLYGSLKSLLQHSFPDIEFVDNYSNSDFHWQWHCPMLSLPLVLASYQESIPALVPYLSVEQARIEVWKTKIDALNLPTTKRRIGVVWQTGKKMKNAPLRSLSLQQLSPLLELDACCWFSLQKEPDPDVLPWVNSGSLIDWSAEFKDFHDTAALAMNLDLIISVDTSVVHLAGALGKPTWLFNRHASEWRWMHDREDSPWYPTMRIFNQKTAGDWDEVVEQMRLALVADL